MYIRNRSRQHVDFSFFAEESETVSRGNINWKFVPIYFIIFLIFTFLLFNLFILQLIDGGDYLLAASRTSRNEQKIIPPRGLIYDINGEKLAYNIPSYTLFLDPSEVEDAQSIIAEIAYLLNVDEVELYEKYQNRLEEMGERSYLGRVTVSSNLSYDKYIDALSSLSKISGVYIEVEPKREYQNGEVFSHIIGYIGDPNEKEIENGIYSMSQVGKVGIEHQYDTELRGEIGTVVIEQSSVEDKTSEFVPVDPILGKNIYLTIDAEWQQKLTKIMNDQLNTVEAFASAGVIIDRDTGEIKSLVSLPTYDNNLFINGISNNDYSSLINNHKTPLLNRVIGLQLPPGSIFKIIGATTALEENIINANTQLLSDRCMELPGDISFCEADRGYVGWVNVKDALAKSSNIFFCKTVLKLNAERDGIYSTLKYADSFGIGKVTGIDLSGEQPGTMASPELKKKLLNEPWYVGDECNAVIGQGLVTVTPIQMAVMSSVIASDGKVIKPHLVSKIIDQSGEEVQIVPTEIVNDIQVSPDTFQTIREGMRKSVQYGTASQLNSFQGKVFAKTGSSDAAENIQGEYYSGAHSWVTGCFEYFESEYCFAFIQQWGGRGYKTVPIVKRFMNCLYNSFEDSCENV